MAIFQGIEHVAIFSPDTRRLCDWYTHHLDMKVILDDGVGGFFLLLADGSMVELVPSAEPSVCAGTPMLKDSGLRHLALTVAPADFDAVVHRLTELGVATIGRTPYLFPEGMATFHFRDPDGNILHLIARTRSLTQTPPPQLADAPREVLIQGLEHVGIIAHNLKRLLQWYVDVMGFQLIVSDDGYGTAFVLAPDGRSVLEFIQAERKLGAEPHRAQGIRHLAIRVAQADVEGAAKLLKAAGVTVLEDYKALDNGVRLFFFRDPEGNVMHLIGRSQPLAH